MARPFFIRGTTFYAFEGDVGQAFDFANVTYQNVEKYQEGHIGQDAYEFVIESSLMTLRLNMNLHSNGFIDYELFTGDSKQSQPANVLSEGYISSGDPEQSRQFRKDFDKALIQARAKNLSQLRKGLTSQGDIQNESVYVPSDVLATVGSFLTGVGGTLDVQNARLLEQNELVGGRSKRVRKSKSKSKTKQKKRMMYTSFQKKRMM